MDTRTTIERSEQDGGRPGRRLTRGLLLAALVSFSLPFLTVTCYGDDVTISGVQAATSIDLTPQEHPDPGDRQFADEHEPVSPFAFGAFGAAATATVLAFVSKRTRAAVVTLAAAAAVTIPGLWFYAIERSSGHAFPDVGMALAIGLLTSAAWVEVGAVPRWAGALGVGVGVAMIGSTLGGVGALEDLPILVVVFWVGQVVASCLAVGAILAVVRPSRKEVARPRTLRLVLASVTGAACIGAGTVASFFVPAPFAYGTLGRFQPFLGGTSYVVCVALGGAAAWLVGGLVAHGRRRRPAVERRPAIA
jgi:hypothetical protein